MMTFFTRERFGGPQAIAALLLLAFLLQCAWLISRTLRTNGGTNIGELERIHEGLQQWRGRGIAGTIDSEFRRQVSLELPKDEYDRDRSPLWYLIASAPLVAWSGTLGPETVHSWGWLARAPYISLGCCWALHFGTSRVACSAMWADTSHWRSTAFRLR